MVTIIHTADLQLGKAFGAFDDEARPRLYDARFDVLDRIAEVAKAKHAALIVVAGDVFDLQGLSDHTLGTAVATTSIAFGAKIIEKHFTLRRADGGVDGAFSLEPEELLALVVETERAWQSLGNVTYGPSNAEKKSLIFRRSIYIAQDLKAGDVLTPENMRCVRPGLGLAPKYYKLLLGKRVSQDVVRGTPMSWDLVG